MKLRNHKSVVYVLMTAAFLACSTTSDPPFGSRDEAYDALVNGEDGYYVTGFYSGAIYSVDVIDNFDGTGQSVWESALIIGFKQARFTAPSLISKIHGGHYDSTTGQWTFDSTYTAEGVELNVDAGIKFTPRDSAGFPTDSTDEVNAFVDYDYESIFVTRVAQLAPKSILSKIAASTYRFQLEEDLDLSGAKRFRQGSGNLLINAFNGFNFDIDDTDNDSRFRVDYELNYDDLVIPPPNITIYPLSGTVDFTLTLIVHEVDEEAGEIDINRTVHGSITFDGTSVAVLRYGGYDFYIDLLNGAILLDPPIPG